MCGRATRSEIGCSWNVQKKRAHSQGSTRCAAWVHDRACSAYFASTIFLWRFSNGGRATPRSSCAVALGAPPSPAVAAAFAILANAGFFLLSGGRSFSSDINLSREARTYVQLHPQHVVDVSRQPLACSLPADRCFLFSRLSPTPHDLRQRFLEWSARYPAFGDNRRNKF